MQTKQSANTVQIGGKEGKKRPKQVRITSILKKYGISSEIGGIRGEFGISSNMPGTGRKIRILRVKNGLTQTQLARKVGATQKQISKLETGSTKIVDLSLVQRIADIFGVTLDSFREDDERQTRGGEVKIKELLGELKKVSENQTELIKKIVDVLATLDSLILVPIIPMLLRVI